MLVESPTTSASRLRLTILIVICFCIWCTSFAFFAWFYSRLPLALTAVFTVFMVMLGPVNIISRYIED